jgi:hypothetical protein
VSAVSTLSIPRVPTAAAQSGRLDLAVLYEHPHWFAAIFAELERREIPFDRIFIPEHFYEVGEKEPGFKVLFNRMSPSAHSRERGSGIFHSLAYLEHLELQGIRVINGRSKCPLRTARAAWRTLHHACPKDRSEMVSIRYAIRQDSQRSASNTAR